MSSLKRHIQLYDFYQKQLEDLDCEIEELLKKFPSWDEPLSNFINQSKKSKRKNKKKGVNAAKFDVEKYVCQITGVDLFAVDGFGSNNMLGIISETGLDMTKWKTEKHFTSWLCLSPNNKISGGKVISRYSKKTKSRANELFRIAAQSLARSKCALGAYYRRLCYRLGAPKAIVATARKLAIIYYNMLRYKIEYKDLGAEKYESQYRLNQVKSLEKKAQALGFKVVKIAA